jgi:catechol 2,3-dioxygenase-like lactoylglutathione lyase family enzyme|tara:strand:- start:68455 stop:68883 length:429 start_codon:yes stop_codon:yes gene_type:complete
MSVIRVDGKGKEGLIMRLKHVALVCSSEKRCDKFYKNLLGLKKTSTKNIPSTLSKQIFNIDSEYKIINYADNAVHFEIFISRAKSQMGKRIAHTCLEVGNTKSFLDRCRSSGIKIIQIETGGKSLIFIRDDDGNLFEIKEEK